MSDSVASTIYRLRSIVYGPSSIVGRSSFVLRRWSVAAVAVFGGLFLVRYGEQLRSHVWELAPGWIGLALLATAGYWLALAVGWTECLRVVGAEMSRGSAIRFWLASMATRYLPGNVWHVVARMQLTIDRQVSPSRVLGASALEQGLTVAGAPLALLVWLPLWSPGDGLGLLKGLPVLGCAPHPTSPPGGKGEKGKGHPEGTRQKGKREGTIPSSLFPFSPFRLFAFSPFPPGGGVGRGIVLVGWYAAAQSLAGLGFALSVAALEPAALARFPMLVGAYLVAWTVGYLSLVTPMGLGVREGTLVLLLTPSLGLPTATGAAALARLVQTVVELTAAGGAVVVGRARRRRPAVAADSAGIGEAV